MPDDGRVSVLSMGPLAYWRTTAINVANEFTGV